LAETIAGRRQQFISLDAQQPTSSNGIERGSVFLFDSYWTPRFIRVSPAGSVRAASAVPAFPGAKPIALSNIPVRVPLHFLRREDALEKIEAAHAKGEGRTAVMTLHGLSAHRSQRPHGGMV